EGSRRSSCPGKRCALARKNDPKLSVCAGLGVDIDRPAMLLDDDVMADRKTKPRPFASRLCCEERIEHPFFHFRQNSVAIVSNPDFDAVAEIFCRCRQRRLIAISPIQRLALCCSIKAIRNEVEEDARNLLWIEIGLAGSRIKRSLQGNVEPLFLGPGTVIGEIEAFVDDGINIDWPVLARALARVEKHVLDDGISALAVLHDLLEVTTQHVHELGQLITGLSVEFCPFQSLSNFIDELGGHSRE